MDCHGRIIVWQFSFPLLMKVSGKTQRDPFLFAGFVGPEPDWSQVFVPEWQKRVLDGPPQIPYLHMTEIRSELWRQQYGLSRIQAEARVDEAFAVLDSVKSFYPVGVNVNAGSLRDEFAEIRVTVVSRAPQPLEPDYICFLGYAFFILNYIHKRHPEAEKVDFIVERKLKVTRYIQEFHSQLHACLKAVGNPELSDLIGELIPADKTRLPLQAADLLCWYTARPADTMDADDIRRYAMLEKRKGCQMEISDQDIRLMCAAITP